MDLAAVALGVVVGLLLGLTGAGGSVLAVPLLMAERGWALPQAAPVALIAVAGSAALGAWTAWRRSYLRYRAATLMGLCGLCTAPLGLWLAQRLPLPLLTALFALVMLVVATRLALQAWRRPEESRVVRASVQGDDAEAAARVCRLNPATGRLIWTPATFLTMGGIGACTGVLSGMLGVGGGFVIVPALRATTPLSMQSAIATSLMTIALVASGTLGIFVLRGSSLPWSMALPFGLAAAAGMALGRVLAPRIAGPRLELLFACSMLAGAAQLAYKAAA